MELVLLERRFEQPVTFDEIQALEDAGAWCLSTQNVRFLKTFFSRDRRRMLCLYEAPDAEAVRLAESQAKVPFERAWSCEKLQSCHAVSLDSLTEDVIVERQFPEPISREFVVNAYNEKGWCLKTYSVEHVETYISNDGTRMVCLFRAPDAEAVRMSNKLGGVPFSEVWTASLHLPRTP